MTADSPRVDANPNADVEAGAHDGTFSPLPGEMGIPDVAAHQRHSVSRKGLLAVLLLVGSSVIVSALAIQRFVAGAPKSQVNDGKSVADKPAAASTQPRKLDLASALAASSPAAAAPPPRIPALVPTEDELAEPIGVRRTGSGAPSSSGTRTMSPEDAPVLLVSTRPGQGQGQGQGLSAAPQALGSPSSPLPGETDLDPHDPLQATSRNLQGYQRQLQGLLETLTRSADLARGGTASAPTVPTPAGAFAMNAPGVTSPTGLLGGQLLGSSTPRATATRLGHRSLILPKGTSFTCALKSRVVTANSGLVGCMVQRHVYGDDGRVVLIERGSHLDGEYRITTVRPGMVRIPVLWTRVRTPLGVTVDLDSPATGPLGESGIEGHVDNRWTERIGAAMLLSLIDDSVKLVIQQQSNDRQGDTIVLPSTTANTSKLAEKVLDSTIHIPPLIYQNQGGIVGIHVARDVDFSGVYELVPTTEGPARP